MSCGGSLPPRKKLFMPYWAPNEQTPSERLSVFEQNLKKISRFKLNQEIFTIFAKKKLNDQRAIATLVQFI